MKSGERGGYTSKTVCGHILKWYSFLVSV